MATKSNLRVTTLNGDALWRFPFEVASAQMSVIAPLTLGVVKSNIVTTETDYTDSITDPEGDMNTGIKQRQMQLVFRHTPDGQDARVRRITIPAPVLGDLGIYAVADDDGLYVPAVMDGTGKDGNELATLFKQAMALPAEDDFEFMSGKVVTVRHSG